MGRIFKFNQLGSLEQSASLTLRQLSSMLHMI